MVFYKLLLAFNFAEQDTFHPNIRFYDKGIGKSRLLNFFLYLVIRPVVHHVNSSGNKMGGKLVIHLFFPFAFKSAKGDGRIGGAKVPERPAADTIPKPDKADREIEYVKIPKFPMRQSLNKFLHACGQI